MGQINGLYKSILGFVGELQQIELHYENCNLAIVKWDLWVQQQH